MNQHDIVSLTGSLGLPPVASDRLGGGHTVGPVVVLGGRGFVSVQEEVGGTGRRCQVVGGWVSGAVPRVPDCTSCKEREMVQFSTLVNTDMSKAENCSLFVSI